MWLQVSHVLIRDISGASLTNANVILFYYFIFNSDSFTLFTFYLYQILYCLFQSLLKSSINVLKKNAYL